MSRVGEDQKVPTILPRKIDIVNFVKLATTAQLVYIVINIHDIIIIF